MNTLYMSDRPFVAADREIAHILLGEFHVDRRSQWKGLISWPEVGVKPEVMEVGDKTGSVPAAGDAAKFAFFDKFLTRNK